MQFSISDYMISQFLSGALAVFSLLGIGAILMLLLMGLARSFPFCRLALTLALTPLCLVSFLERSAMSTLYLYAMIVILLGITIDGISHVLTPKQSDNKPKEQLKFPAEPSAEAEEPDPDTMVWEKVE